MTVDLWHDIEGEAYRLAKAIIAEAGHLRMPHPWPGGLTAVADVEGSDRPELSVLVGHRRIAIELFITRRSSLETVAQIRRDKVSSFEINLSAWRRRALDDDFREAVLQGATRSWIYDPDKPPPVFGAEAAARATATQAERDFDLPPPKPEPVIQAWVRDEYDTRRCAHDSCTGRPLFGFGPPFTQVQAWTCRNHRDWFKERVKTEGL